MSEEELKITIPAITETELERIDNNLHEIVNEFIKVTVKDKDLVISQHIIKRLEEENKQLNQELISVNKGLNKILSKRKKWKNRYYKERRNKKQLEQALIDIREYINNTTTMIVVGKPMKLSEETSGKDILQIIDKVKVLGDDK